MIQQEYKISQTLSLPRILTPMTLTLGHYKPFEGSSCKDRLYIYSGPQKENYTLSNKRALYKTDLFFSNFLSVLFTKVYESPDGTPFSSTQIRDIKVFRRDPCLFSSTSLRIKSRSPYLPKENTSFEAFGSSPIRLLGGRVPIRGPSLGVSREDDCKETRVYT